MRNALTVIGLLLPALVAGCANQEMGFPRPFHQGTAQQQRTRAQHFDPYPTDAGGGDTTGGRPEDYHEQIPEPARSRWTLPKFLTRRPVPPPMVAPPATGPVLVPPGAAPVSSYPPAGYPSTPYTTGAQGPSYSTGDAVPGGYAPAYGS